MKQLSTEESDFNESGKMNKVKALPTSSDEDQTKIKMELPVNVFCSICNHVFDFVTDLQNHLSDHLHLDKERRIAIEKLQGLAREEAKNNNYNGLVNSVKEESGTSFNEDQETMEIPETFGNEHDEEMGEVIEITPELHYLEQSQTSGGYFTPELESALLAHYSDHFPSLWITLSENRVNQYYNGNEIGDKGVTINEKMDSIDSVSSTEKIESASESEEEEQDDEEDEDEEETRGNYVPDDSNFVCPSCSLRFSSLNGCSAHLLTGSCLKNCILEEKYESSTFLPQPTYQCPCCEKQFLNMRSFGTHCYNHILECKGSKPSTPNNNAGKNKVMQTSKKNPIPSNIPDNMSSRIVQSPRQSPVPVPRFTPNPRAAAPSRSLPPPHVTTAPFPRISPPSRSLPPQRVAVVPPPKVVSPPCFAPVSSAGITASTRLAPTSCFAPPQRVAPTHQVAPLPRVASPPRVALSSPSAPPPRIASPPRIAPPSRTSPSSRIPSSHRVPSPPRVASSPPRIPAPVQVPVSPVVPEPPVIAVENTMTDSRTSDSPVRVTRKSMRLKLKLQEQRTIVLTPSEVKSAMLKPPLTNPKSFAFKEPDILSCATCDETFENAESCCTHLRYLNDKPFICTHCGKLFKFEEARDVHQRQPHVIPCSRCIVDVYFVSNSCLLLHCRQYHSSND